MSQPRTRAGQIFQFLAIFAFVYLLTQMTFKYIFPDQYGPEKDLQGVILTMTDKTVKGQHHPIALIKNKSEEELVLEDRCPNAPVDVVRIFDDGTKKELASEVNAVPCEAVTSVAAGETVQLDLAPWKYSLFDAYGTYEITLPIAEESKSLIVEESNVTTQFSIYEPGMMTQVFRTFISKPLLNLLVFIASLMPDYSLGIAIIILTIIVKFILFAPTQHAMEGQRKMQAVQPQMDALRAKYKDNPQKMQEATMKLWKENKVNPMQSCLPMLIQFPVLIGLFFVIRDGSILNLSTHLLYSPYQDLPWTFGTNFLGMDLTVPNVHVMPILLVVLQFAQMKLAFAINEKKKEKTGKKKDKAPSQQEVQQKVMMYGLPLLIGFFALQFPAAVSLYWAVQAVFGILQQLYVNRKEL